MKRAWTVIGVGGVPGRGFRAAPPDLARLGDSCRLIAHSNRERIAEFSIILID
jgi:hypothetical protein